MGTAYDAIIVGAGHNGLVAANYLARAGLKTAVLEARYIVGGACVTEELIKGAKFSSCAFVQGTSRPEIVDEFKLSDFGLEMTAPEVQVWRSFRTEATCFCGKMSTGPFASSSASASATRADSWSSAFACSASAS